MLCSSCYRKILIGEELQIEGAIICKECSLTKKKLSKKEIISECRTCYWPIYKDDLTHDISENISFGLWGFVNITQFRRAIQCDWCYKKWLNDVKREEEWWKKTRGIFFFFTILFSGAGALLLLFFLEQKYTNLIVFIPAIILAIIPLFRTILIKKFNRYTIRKRKK